MGRAPRAPRAELRCRCASAPLLGLLLISSAQRAAAAPAPAAPVARAWADAALGDDAPGCGADSGATACRSASAALAAARAAAAVDARSHVVLKVILAAGTYSGAANADIVVHEDATFEAEGYDAAESARASSSPRVTFALAGSARAFAVHPPPDAPAASHPFDCPQAALRLRGIAIAGGYALGSGGAVHCTRAAVDAEDTHFYANVAMGAGGAIHAEGCSVSLSRVVLTGNVAAVAGGALSLRPLYGSRLVRAVDARVANNSAAMGGAFAITDPDCMHASTRLRKAEEAALLAARGAGAPADALPALAGLYSGAHTRCAQVVGGTDEGTMHPQMLVRGGEDSGVWLGSVPGWGPGAPAANVSIALTPIGECAISPSTAVEQGSHSVARSSTAGELEGHGSVDTAVTTVGNASDAIAAESAMYDFEIMRTTFDGNAAAVAGGAIFMPLFASVAALRLTPSVTGATFVRNVVASAAKGGSLERKLREGLEVARAHANASGNSDDDAMVLTIAHTALRAAVRVVLKADGSSSEERCARACALHTLVQTRTRHC